MASRLVFATVGTTKFDSLVYNITKEDTLKALKKIGCKNLKIQIGNGTILPNKENAEKVGINVMYYRFKNNIDDDIAEADLVISHAGAGSCLEVLEREKPLLVVINEDLMHNHQAELAEKLSLEGYLFACKSSTLYDTINDMDLMKLKKFRKSDPNLFPKFLNTIMGFSRAS